MRYVVFSFDDALIDFYENAYPLFKKYNFSCSINVIPGISDNTVKSSFKCISVDQIVGLYNEHFEIANHTNSHLGSTTYEDIMMGDNKLKSYIGNIKYGLVLPYSQIVDSNLVDKISDNFLYMADFHNQNKERPIFLKLIRKFKILNKENFDYFYCNYSYIYNVSNFASNDVRFHRLPIHKETTPSNIIYFLKKMKNNEAVVLMFHSIVKNENDMVPWEEGKWTTNKLENLLKFLKNSKRFKVCTQKELLEYAKK